MMSQSSAMDASGLCLLSCLAIFSVAGHAGGSRYNDSSEVAPPSPLNNTRQWSPSLVSAANPVEEGILKSERSRETSVSDLSAKANEERERIIELEDESYESPDSGESPPFEEDIVSLEQNREIILSENLDSLPFQEPSDTFFQSKGGKEYSRPELEKQINATSSLGNSPVEEGILDAERDRDETLSDIFRSGSSSDQKKDYGTEYKTDLTDKETEGSDEPKFEFLIGLPLENFTGKSTNKDGSVDTQTRKPFVPPKSAWPVPRTQSLTADPRVNHTTGIPVAEEGEDKPALVEDYVELVEIAKNGNTGGDLLGNRSATAFAPHANRTGFFLENDAPESRFTDLQTLFLACFATLVPLLMALFLACGLRVMWRRYVRGRRGEGYGLRGGCRGSADPVAVKRLHSNSTQAKLAESGFSDGTRSADKEGGGTPTAQHPANGSIITMTLKNNHLIVETEVRNDIARGSRETKMKYSPNNDGVFVVEVQQSNTKPGNNPGSPGQRAMVHHSPIAATDISGRDQDTSGSPNIPRQQAKKSFGSTNTGLSTSDLSISSADNPSYAYGNQVGYEHGHYGYPLYAGYATTPIATIPCESSREPLLSKTPTDPDKPIITAAIFKQDSIIAGDDAMKSSGYNIEGSTDGPLLSDIQAREVSLHKLQDKIEHGAKARTAGNSDSVHSSDTEEERYQEQQRQLGNGTVRKEQTVVEINHDKTNQCLHRADSLPPRLADEADFQKNGKISDAQKNSSEDNFDTIEEESSVDCYPGDIASGSPLLCHSAGMAAAGARSKRASLPIITPDLYTSIKQTTKSMLPSLSPKFEKFSNEHSPAEGSDRQGPPPLITVTEEAESPMCSDENDSTQS